jgi:hypothetical protein
MCQRESSTRPPQLACVADPGQEILGAVAVSIEARPEAAHREHDHHRRQEQKEWKPPSLAPRLRWVFIYADCNAPGRAGQAQR